MDAISEAHLGEIHPALADRVRQMANRSATEGCEIRVTQGLRSWSKQDELYKRGRSEPGNPCSHDGLLHSVGSCALHPMGLTVTKATGGESWHNFGLAVDVVPDDISKPGFQADWNAAHPAWKRLVEIGKSLGLTAGAEFRTFPDFPHFQLTGRFPVSPDSEVRQLFRSGGMQAVWDEAKIV